VLGDGRVLAAVHPKALDALAHLSGDAPIAPSRIVQLDPGRQGEGTIVYEDPGEELSAAAVGARLGDRLLIGPVRADHFLDCRMAPSSAGP
jgi:arylesterase/paraoxonase